EHLPVLGPDRLGGEPGVVELAEPGIAEPDGEGAYRRLRHGRHQGRQPARIDAAGQKQADGHVADQLAADDVLEPLAHLARALRETGARLPGRDRRLPITALPEPVFTRPRKRAPGKELADAF